jgi:hypothetical protein
LHISKSSRRLLTLVHYQHGEPSREVCFTETTWERLIELKPLISHVLEQYKRDAPAALALYETLSHMADTECEFAAEITDKQRIDVVKKYVSRLTNIVQDDVVADPLFDQKRAVEEMKLYCVGHIAEECKTGAF